MKEFLLYKKKSMVEEINVILVDNWKLWMLFLNMVSPWVSGVHNCQIRICISIELQKMQITLLPIHSYFTVVLSYNSQEINVIYMWTSAKCKDITRMFMASKKAFTVHNHSLHLEL